MNIFLFILAMPIYFYMCYLGMRTYFFVAIYTHQNFPKVVVHLALFVWLIIFALFLLPVLFFPAWLSEKLVIFERSSTITSILILLGGVVLVMTLWRGWLSKDGIQFREILGKGK